MKKLVLAFLGCALVMNLVGCHGSNSGTKWVAALTPAETALTEVTVAVANLDDALLLAPGQKAEVAEKAKETLVATTALMNSSESDAEVVAGCFGAMVSSEASSMVTPEEVCTKVDEIFKGMDSFAGIAILPKEESGQLATDVKLEEAVIGGVTYKNVTVELGTGIGFDGDGRINRGLEDIISEDLESIANKRIKIDGQIVSADTVAALKAAYQAKLGR